MGGQEESCIRAGWRLWYKMYREEEKKEIVWECVGRSLMVTAVVGKRKSAHGTVELDRIGERKSEEISVVRKEVGGAVRSIEKIRE